MIRPRFRLIRAAWLTGSEDLVDAVMMTPSTPLLIETLLSLLQTGSC
jgi:hypothetical protein